MAHIAAAVVGLALLVFWVISLVDYAKHRRRLRSLPDFERKEIERREMEEMTYW